MKGVAYGSRAYRSSELIVIEALAMPLSLAGGLIGGFYQSILQVVVCPCKACMGARQCLRLLMHRLPTLFVSQPGAEYSC